MPRLVIEAGFRDCRKQGAQETNGGIVEPGQRCGSAVYLPLPDLAVVEEFG